MKKDISLNEIVSELLKRSWVVVIVAIACAAVFGFYAKQKKVTSYVADSEITIAHNYSEIGLKNDMFKLDTNMSLTYEKMDDNLNVIKSIKSNYKKEYGKKIKQSISDFSNKIDMSATAGTVVYNVSATANSSKKAIRLANVSSKVLKNKIPELVPNSGSVKIISKASKSTVNEHSEISVKKYAAIGFLFGFIISVFIYVFRLFINR